jgi:hypothetical protein
MLSRTRTFADDKQVGGQVFRIGGLSHLLAYRVYVGEVCHHKQHYIGEHKGANALKNSDGSPKKRNLYIVTETNGGGRSLWRTGLGLNSLKTGK